MLPSKVYGLLLRVGEVGMYIFGLHRRSPFLEFWMKIVAFAALALALLLAAGAVSIFGSGNPGMLGIVGASMAAGSLGLFVLGIRLFLTRREPAASEARGRGRPRPMSSPLSPGQRPAYMTIGVLMLAMTAHALWTGKVEQVRASALQREDKPVAFWTMVLLYGGVGAFLLRRGLRRPPGGADHEEDRD